MIAIKKHLARGALFGFLLSFLPGAGAQNLLQNGDFSQKTTVWQLPNAQKASAKVVPITDPITDFSIAEAAATTPRSALQIEVAPAPGDKPYALILRQKLSAAWKRGEPLRFRAWMRSPQSAKALIFVESGAPTFTKSLQKEVTLSAQWQPIEVFGEALADLPAGETSMGFHLGYGAATVEIADVRLSKEAAVPAGAAPQIAAQIAAQSLISNGDFSGPLTGKWTANGIEIWNEVGILGLPIEITEFDAGIPDDKLHGEYVRDFLIAAFSQPQIESIVLWGFWEGAHWRAGEGGAMMRRDWTPRPAQIAYEELVLKRWMTNISAQSDANGSVKARGFAGDYQIRVEANRRVQTQILKLTSSGATALLKLS